MEPAGNDSVVTNSGVSEELFLVQFVLPSRRVMQSAAASVRNRRRMETLSGVSCSEYSVRDGVRLTPSQTPGHLRMRVGRRQRRCALLYIRQIPVAELRLA